MAAIEAYLACHPEAADSAEGIARWWLAARGIDTDADTVTQALQRLVEFGTVRVRRTPDGRRLYIATVPPAAKRTH
ncbi:hypothetical protein C667_18412 [Thauera phenylacetica B4P]|uniref:Uncharacterized protein n=2 Tax=Thauera phenylacetica TaxID=164400 RepID=N6ZLY4_9RHOO|nr:hypothetical protein C667_18412 [Thauera phenylacetica B4P]